jgi:hypothetical protein
VWSPYFFEEDNVTVTMTSNQYCAILENFLWPTLVDIFDEHGTENVWFQQDGEIAHTSCCSLRIFGEMFPGHVVSLRGDIGWPLRSPNLTPCDLFL